MNVSVMDSDKPNETITQFRLINVVKAENNKNYPVYGKIITIKRICDD